MTLVYIALGVLIVNAALVVHGVVAVYGGSHQITKVRHRPHRDAVGAATRFSLLRLGMQRMKAWLSCIV